MVEPYEVFSISTPR